MDLRGKVLLMLNNDPDWDDSLRRQAAPLSRPLELQVRERRATGAAGALIIHTTPSASTGQVVQSG
ncbi:MAG: hypothetical protein R2862_11340 [Thermoanaerobaculia bacterium]